MEDDLNGIQPQWKTNSMDDNLNERRPQWKTTSIEYNRNEIRPQWKMTLLMRTTSMEDEPNIRRSQ